MTDYTKKETFTLTRDKNWRLSVTERTLFLIRVISSGGAI